MRVRCYVALISHNQQTLKKCLRKEGERYELFSLSFPSIFKTKQTNNRPQNKQKKLTSNIILTLSFLIRETTLFLVRQKGEREVEILQGQVSKEVRQRSDLCLKIYGICYCTLTGVSNSLNDKSPLLFLNQLVNELMCSMDCTIKTMCFLL